MHPQSHDTMIRAVVLDWAGTVVDHGCRGPVAVFMDVFASHGITIKLAEIRKDMGLKKKDHLRKLYALPSIKTQWQNIHEHMPTEQEIDQLNIELESKMLTSLLRHGDPIPGAVEAVARFREMGLKIGSCTGYTRSMMDVLEPVAKEKGYAPDVVICSSDVPAGRPLPWMCWLNAIRLEIYPLKTMVKIGDTLNDIREGLNAGMWTIGLTRTGNELGLSLDEVKALDDDQLESLLGEIATNFNQEGAHFVVQSLADCPEIITRINKRLAMGQHP